MRLNLGGGPVRAPGWVSLDLEGGEVRADAGRLPFRTASLDGCFANHSLCAMTTQELPAVVAEVRRVLAPGARFRVSVPDIVAAFHAHEREDSEWFPNHAQDGALCLGNYLTWFSTNRTCFTWGSLWALLREGGFANIGDTPAGAGELDDRLGESLFLEAW